MTLRLVGVEEHFVTHEVLDVGRSLAPDDRDLAFGPASEGDTSSRLLDVSRDRLAAMAATGLDTQVLSLTTPGLQNLRDADAVSLQRSTNDVLADTVRADPEHFQGLAALATTAPDAAAAELDRAVRTLHLDGAMLYGRTGDQHLDHRDLWPVFEAAEALRVPLYLHPQCPPFEVRDAYYGGFDDVVSAAFATHGIGWHYEAGIEFVRLVLSGALDRFPDLQLIIGHWGELVLFYLERIEHLARLASLPRTLSEYVRSNLYITPSGILSDRYLRWATEIVGAERLLFATDYPFEAASQRGARPFLDNTTISDTNRELLAHGNWDRLRSSIRR